MAATQNLNTYRLAREAIQRAQADQSLNNRSYGGHKHTGPNHPLTGKPAMSARRYPKR